MDAPLKVTREEVIAGLGGEAESHLLPALLGNEGETVGGETLSATSPVKGFR